MKMRLADYVARFLVDHGVTEVFSVVGGGAMHLNDALGHAPGLHVTYCHHEQACAMAAESYARLTGKMAAVCVTSGPGGTNALTGVLGAYLDSIPMFVISGQVRYDTTARYLERELKRRDIDQFVMDDGLGHRQAGPHPFRLRSVGDQEYDITRAAGEMTKYAVMVEHPQNIRLNLEHAYVKAVTGRPGPVWIDIPVDFQAAEIYPDGLSTYIKKQTKEVDADTVEEDRRMKENAVRQVADLILHASRPVIYAGSGIRHADIFRGGIDAEGYAKASANAQGLRVVRKSTKSQKGAVVEPEQSSYEAFRDVVDLLKVPVVTYWNSIDLLETDHPCYIGRGGNMGDRPGNWAVQKADVILAIGTRLSIRQVGYNWEKWAPEAHVIMVDIDPREMEKLTIHVDDKIVMDAGEFLRLLKAELKKAPVIQHSHWLGECQDWKKNYPVLQKKQKEQKGHFANVYAFVDEVSGQLPEGSVSVLSNGACCVAGTQAFQIQKNSRVIVNSAVASMGYGLPAAIGACIGNDDKPVVCLEGDGSLMMNLQELQTVLTNKLPIKLFLINNEGYHSIRQTQNHFFGDHLHVGIGPESGDLSFPKYKKIAEAFGYPYLVAHSNEEAEVAVKKALAVDGPVFIEVFTDTSQEWEPKSTAKRLADGTMVSTPLEDMAPFLPEEELKDVLDLD